MACSFNAKEVLFLAQQVTKDIRIGELLMMDRGTAAILMQNGMHCVGCPSSAMETLEEACGVHGIDVEEVLEKLNK